MIDLRTDNLGYLLPNAANLMKSEDLPRLIVTLQMLDADIAAILTGMVGLAPKVHTHEMTEIIGLVNALAGKSSVGHNHGIGTLTGVDLSSATNGQFMKFNGTLWIPATIAAADLADKIITDAKLRNSAALSILGRAAASLGSPADISATANDRLLARVSDALAFVQLTLGMVPDNLLTFAKLASAAIASQAQAEAGTATDKLMTPLQTAQAIAALASSIPLKVTKFTAGGTFTKDAKAKFIRFRAVGGGGGGGGAGSASGAIGGAGEAGFYVSALYDASSVVGAQTISIGAAGTAGSSSPGNGGDGGTTSVGSLISCPGGVGGVGKTTAGQGNYNNTYRSETITGSPIFIEKIQGVPYIHVNTATNTTLAGFSSPLGRGGEMASDTAGSPGDGYGAGGGGGVRAGANRAGGAGSPGIVIVEEYF